MLKILFYTNLAYFISSTKIEQLSRLISNQKMPILTLNKLQFDEFVLDDQKNYSAFVMFTLLNSDQCKICQQFYEEYRKLAISWSMNKHSNEIFFMLADFQKSPEIFQAMQFNSVPILMHFSPKIRNLENYPIEKLGLTANGMAHWVESKTKIHIDIRTPLNYSRLIGFAVVAVCILFAGYLLRRHLTFIFSRYLYAHFAIAFVFTMISGQMWNRIRQPPFKHHNQRTGQDIFIAPGGSSQFVAESYIIIALNCAITLGFIMLKEAAIPRKLITTNIRKGIALVGVVILSVFFSQLLSIFRSKYGNYPYSFLFK